MGDVGSPVESGVDEEPEPPCRLRVEIELAVDVPFLPPEFPLLSFPPGLGPWSLAGKNPGDFRLCLVHLEAMPQERRLDRVQESSTYDTPAGTAYVGPRHSEQAFSCYAFSP